MPAGSEAHTPINKERQARPREAMAEEVSEERYPPRLSSIEIDTPAAPSKADFLSVYKEASCS
jgi:hypothetical protein